MTRLRIGVLFGGRSTEHEVSILSAQSIIAAMDPKRFEPVPLYIDKNGRWLVGGSLKRLVSADAARLRAFMEALGGEMIVKPLDGCGGAGPEGRNRLLSADGGVSRVYLCRWAHSRRLHQA